MAWILTVLLLNTFLLVASLALYWVDRNATKLHRLRNRLGVRS